MQSSTGADAGANYRPPFSSVSAFAVPEPWLLSRDCAFWLLESGEPPKLHHATGF